MALGHQSGNVSLREATKQSVGLEHPGRAAPARVEYRSRLAAARRRLAARPEALRQFGHNQLACLGRFRPIPNAQCAVLRISPDRRATRYGTFRSMVGVEYAV